jgi:hypothetical protein
MLNANELFIEVLLIPPVKVVNLTVQHGKILRSATTMLPCAMRARPFQELQYSLAMITGCILQL